MAASGLDFYYIIQPEATINMLTNPSFETGTTTYTAVGGSISRVTTYQRFGRYALEVVPSSGSFDGVYTGTWTLTASLPYTFSVYGFWASGVPYRINFGTTVGGLLGTATDFVGAGKWERKEVTYTPGTTSVRIYITKNNVATTGGATFRIDGLQLEQKAYSTTYIDGSLDGGFWNALPHASTSARYANYRKGGKKVLLSTYDAYVTDNTGIGTPPVEAVILPYGYAPGGTYQGTLVKPRTMTIGVTVSAGIGANPQAQTDLNDWFINMESIFNLIKPDLVDPPQPFVLGWQHNNNDIEIECVYSGGMDFQNEKLVDISDNALQLTCPNPFWIEPVNQAASLTVSGNSLGQGAGNEDIWVRDSDGVWTNITSGGANSFSIVCMYFNPIDGNLYVGGNITTINGVSATNIAMFNMVTRTWSALGTGCNATVRAIIQPPIGNLIAAGDFTTAGGVTMRCIGQYNAGTWSVVGQAAPFATTSPTPSIRCMAIEPLTGHVLIGGNFVNGSTGSPCLTDYFGRVLVSATGTYSWDTGTDYQVNVGASGAVNDIKCYGKYVYITGLFTGVGTGATVSNNGIARLNSLNTSPNMWDNIGTGFGTATHEGVALAIDANGIVYLAGSMVTINGATVNYFGKFDGYQWEQVDQISNTSNVYQEATVDGDGYAQLIFDRNQVLYLNNIGVANASVLVNYHMARLIGSRRVNDLFKANAYGYAGGVAQVMAIHPTSNSIYIATNNADLNPPVTTSVTNSGSANAYPIIRIENGQSGTNVSNIFYIKNNTTGRALWFVPIRSSGAYTSPTEGALLRNETITIDCRIEEKTVISSLRGKQFALDPSSNDGDFFLAPGVNSIEILTTPTTNYTTLTVSLIWNETHWTVSGGHE